MAENKESVVKLEGQGDIHISEDVVASIAALAVSEVDGVASLVTTSGVTDFFGKKNLSRGVKVEIEGTTVTVDVYMLVRYGFSIPSVAQKAQEKVKSGIESMAGLEAGNINIHVNGIVFEKDSKK